MCDWFPKACSGANPPQSKLAPEELWAKDRQQGQGARGFLCVSCLCDFHSRLFSGCVFRIPRCLSSFLAPRLHVNPQQPGDIAVWYWALTCVALSASGGRSDTSYACSGGQDGRGERDSAPTGQKTGPPPEKLFQRAKCFDALKKIRKQKKIKLNQSSF